MSQRPLRVLVAGASGGVGGILIGLLHAEGHAVTALTRRPERLADRLPAGVSLRAGDALDAASLAGCADGADVVFSSVGASVAPQWNAERRSFFDVDLPANRHLLAEAERAGARRFVYLGAFVAPAARYARTRYVRAHEAVVDLARRSGLEHVTVRATGFFGTLAALLDFARRGRVPIVGDGAALTNPVDERDVAAACLEAITTPAPPPDLPVGGPDVLSRRAIAEAAFAALGREPRLSRVPAGAMRGVAHLVRPFHPRLGDVLAFGAAVSVEDCVAPARGTRRLADSFAERARS